MKLLRELIDVLFPPVCEVCGRTLVDGENTICLSCLTAMPRTHYHLTAFNELHKRVAAPGVPVERAAAWFHYYRDNDYARMIQRAKYNNHPEIACRLGEMFAEELPADFFNGIDMLMPMPLHSWKFLKRGYNQSVEIAKGISMVTGLPIADNLKVRRHSTQTRKNAAERAANTAGIAYVTDTGELTDSHLLVIDDIITTGATMLAALRALRQAAPTATLSILSIAATHHR